MKKVIRPIVSILLLTLLSSCTYPFSHKASGVLAINPQFDSAGDFSEGYAAVQKNGKFGYIDKNGETVIPFKFNYARWFVNGTSLVSMTPRERMYDDVDGKFIGQYSLINKSGKIIKTFKPGVEVQNSYRFRGESSPETLVATDPDGFCPI